MSSSLNEWAPRAACAGSFDERFFIDEKNTKIIAQLAEEYCDHCPVLIQCKWFAIDTRSVGVWAGRTTRSRDSVAEMYGKRKADCS